MPGRVLLNDTCLSFFLQTRPPKARPPRPQPGPGLHLELNDFIRLLIGATVVPFAPLGVLAYLLANETLSLISLELESAF